MTTKQKLLPLLLCLLAPSSARSQGSAKYGTIDVSALSCGGAPQEKCDRSTFIADSNGGKPVMECGLRDRINRESLENRFSRAVSRSSWLDQSAVFARFDSESVGNGKGCRRLILSPAPAWITSATWSIGEDKLIIADSLEGSIDLYSTQGVRTAAMTKLKGSPEVDVKPALMRQVPGGYILKNGEGSMLFLNPSFGIIGSGIVVWSAEDQKGSIGAVYDWTAVGDKIVAFADVKEKDWVSAFVEFSSVNPKDFRILKRIPVKSSVRRIYPLGFPYTATVRGVGYFILLGENSQIMKVSSGKVEKLKAFPAGFRVTPTLPWPSSYTDIFGAIEKKSMVVGLYGWGDYLYVLTRKPSVNDSTSWYLSKIDPRTDSLVGEPLRLPVNASHLTVVPGRQFWALIERGKLEKLGEQEIKGVVLLPAPWLEGSAMPLSAVCK